jgi:hypothetical protein
MRHSIFDVITDYLTNSGAVFFTPHEEGDDRLVPKEESEFDTAVVEAEIMAFDAEVAAIYRDAGIPRQEYGSDADVTYLVLPDGRWHLDEHQAYLMLDKQPHLTPKEWVERDVAHRASTR